MRRLIANEFMSLDAVVGAILAVRPGEVTGRQPWPS
jgi:hypothetical protein